MNRNPHTEDCNHVLGVKIRILLVSAAALCISFSAPAQRNLLFSHLTVKDGLSQGTVLCIFQDSRGFIWLGTQDGLNRYDGYAIKTYKNDPTNPSSLTDNFIVSIAEDTSHTLWIGTMGNPAELNRFDPATETFTRRPRDSVNLAKARISASRPEYIDPSGIRWAGSNGKGLSRFDPQTGKTEQFRHDPNDPQSLLDDKVYSVVGDPRGGIWIGTRGGLEQFDPKTGVFRHYRHDDLNPQSLADNYVWPILIDHNGTIWVGTYQGGLDRFDRQSETFIHYRHDENNPRSLSADRIYALYEDASGMIWVGMGDNGVDRFHPGLMSFEHYYHDAGSAGLADNNITCLYVDPTAIAWIGTRSGLNRLDRKTGTFTLFKHDPNNPQSIGDNAVQAMIQDRTGALWIGTVSNGLDQFDARTHSFRHFRNNPADPNSIPDNRIYALCEDHNGELWVGTYGSGLCRLDRSKGTFRTYMHHDSLPASLGGQGVWSLLEDRHGQLWVGTSGGGLDRFDPESETFTHFRHNPADPKSLSDDIVVCLLEDRSDNLWVGTSNGLNRLDRKTGACTIFHEKDGLPNDVILGILEDDKGRLWMSTNKGLSMYTPSSNHFENFDYSDGLQGNEFNQGAYARDSRSGDLFFGGANGFNVFQPGRIKYNTYVPPVVFTAFTRYNSDDAEGKAIVETGIDAKPVITLSYKDNVANFEFASLNYFNSFRNRYAYKLEGYTKGWIHLGPERRATFTNLDGGEYVLHVRGSNNNGVWNEQGSSLRIIVHPPWWKTRWAYGGYFVLFLGFLFGARKVEMEQREQKARIRESDLRAKAAEAEKRALEAENARKTKELEDARQMQLSMLPKELPKVPGYELAVFMKTATEVGGDYYDFNLTADGTLNVAFGDATGHGMQAGIVVTLMKGLFISEGSQYDIPKFFNHCSRAIKEIKLGRLFMALTMARLNGNVLSLSSAAMPPAYLHRKTGDAVEEILLKAVPLGSMKNFPYAQYQTEMLSGDTLLLITDGLPEQKNAAGEMFDYARVTDCFKSLIANSPATIIEQLVHEGDKWMDGVPQDDDITLMIIRRTS